MNSVNEKVLELWKHTEPELTRERMPLFYPELKKGEILFVGMNPSFSKKGFYSFLKESIYSSIDPEEFFKFPQSEEFSIEKSIQIDVLAKKEHPYFDKFRKIADQVHLDWEHVDLFFVRETSQKEAKKLLFKTGNRLSPFGQSQLDLSKTLVEEAEPRIIVVANALASQLFEKHFGAKFNLDLGYHLVNIAGKETPAFLTSMLTGQRALDLFSYQRLCWNIERVLNASE